MKYELVYTHRAVKDIDKLDSKTKTRIGESLNRHEGQSYFSFNETD